eukprot:5713077-Alexandrium_andersonii.AAC.1
MRPGPGGVSWDFDRPEDRDRVIRIPRAERPFVVAGSPPCAHWCGLNTHANHPRMGPAVVAERKREAKAHLEFTAKIYLSR